MWNHAQMVGEGTHPNGGVDQAHSDLVALQAQLWYPEVDGILFEEAVRCFEQGAYRAALVMTWLAIAEGLRYRLGIAARRDLAHIRDQRNHYAHPRGESPSRAQVLAALDAAVRIVLSRPAQHGKEWTDALVKRAATDRTFFPRDPDGLRAYAREIDPLLTGEARQHLARAAVTGLDQLATDPARSDLAAKVAILAGAILERHPGLIAVLDPAARLTG